MLTSLEEEEEIVHSQPGHVLEDSLPEGSICQRPLLLLELQDPVFHGVRNGEARDLHFPLLTDAMTAVDGLVLDSLLERKGSMKEKKKEKKKVSKKERKQKKKKNRRSCFHTGFHQISRRYTLEATVKLSPRLPHFNDMRRILVVGSLRNKERDSSRAFSDIWPSKRTNLYPARVNGSLQKESRTKMKKIRTKKARKQTKKKAGPRNLRDNIQHARELAENDDLLALWGVHHLSELGHEHIDLGR